MTQKKLNQIARSIDGQAAIRREANGKTYIDWYPSVFNQKSKLIREWGDVFFEIIAPGAFDNVLRDEGLNCLATVDHSRGKMLGRNKSGTLTLSTDNTGLKASVEVPDTTLGRDMVVMIERGDYFEGSFIYTIAENGVSYDRSGDIAVRTVTNIADLYDVSIVIDGAFANTAIKLRSTELEIEIKVKFDKDGNPIQEPDPQNPPDPEIERAEAQHNILSKELEILKLKK